MSIIIDDPKLIAALTADVVNHEIRSPAGKMLGRVIPVTARIDYKSICIEDSSLLAAFTEAKVLQELRTSDGRLLGRFVPLDVDWAEMDFDFPEIDYSKAKWYTSDEVMERLRSITREAERRHQEL